MSNNEETQQELDAMAQLRERYPGMDDQQLAAQVISDLDKGAESVKAAKSMVDLLDQNPEVADFMTTMAKHPENPYIAFYKMPKDMLQGVIDNYDNEPENEEDAAQYRAWRQERADKAAREKMINDNYGISRDTISKFAADNGMDPDEWAAAVDEQLVKPMSNGTVSEDMLRGMWLAKNHDRLMQEAREQALTEGRNENIEQQERKRPQSPQVSAPMERVSEDVVMDIPQGDNGGYEDGNAWLTVAKRRSRNF